MTSNPLQNWNKGVEWWLLVELYKLKRNESAVVRIVSVISKEETYQPAIGVEWVR